MPSYSLLIVSFLASLAGQGPLGVKPMGERQ